MDLHLIRNIIARFRISKSMGDPKELVHEYEQMLNKFTLPEDQVASAKAVMQRLISNGLGQAQGITDPGFDAAHTTSLLASVKIERGWPYVYDPGSKLFLALLQSYTLPAPLRKKIEIASRLYLKGMRPRYKAKRPGPERDLEYLLSYEKVMGVWREHLAYAKEAIAKGKEHATEGEGATKLNVGPFTVVNTGGFSEEQMGSVVEVVRKAHSLLQSSGFNEVCYGEIQVTNTIHKGSVWAFYMVTKDELFVRANLKPTVDIVHNVLHELGHRYEHKFLKGGEAPLWRLYHTMESQERTSLKDAKFPDPGTTLVNKGRTFIVTHTTADFRNGYVVHLKMEGGTAKVPLSSFWALKGENLKDPSLGFVTPYAKKSPNENFAEMFAFYCMGKLSGSQKEAFEQAITK